MKLFRRCFAAVAFGCRYGQRWQFSSISEASASDPGKRAAPKKVCLLANTTNTPYSAVLNVAIAKEGKKVGLNVQTLDGNNDTATQAQQMTDLHREGVAGVIVVPVDAGHYTGARARYAKHIPVENSNAPRCPIGSEVRHGLHRPRRLRDGLFVAGTTLGNDLHGKAANIAEIEGLSRLRPDDQPHQWLRGRAKKGRPQREDHRQGGRQLGPTDRSERCSGH